MSKPRQDHRGAGIHSASPGQLRLNMAGQSHRFQTHHLVSFHAIKTPLIHHQFPIFRHTQMSYCWLPVDYTFHDIPTISMANGHFRYLQFLQIHRRRLQELNGPRPLRCGRHGVQANAVADDVALGLWGLVRKEH